MKLFRINTQCAFKLTLSKRLINEVAIGPVTGRDSHSYRSGTQRFFREGRTGKADSALALGCSGKAMIRR